MALLPVVLLAVLLPHALELAEPALPCVLALAEEVAAGERLPPPPPEALPVPLALPPGALPLAQLVLRGEGVLLGEGCELR